eukprot:CAMPEP_0118887984 /NCGR_PEP_ID=MMETSP1163-20130328/25417_1 /TAXON_ID=124430 /ORGANISM="Phaeomonas parva, Strain CCMP2877" /LENGTH=274 /DNA_ID=CAMNT_0006826543 /DNA_START=355 /DNA_END=1179 /DNA_ORIENTATION=-
MRSPVVKQAVRLMKSTKAAASHPPGSSSPNPNPKADDQNEVQGISAQVNVSVNPKKSPPRSRSMMKRSISFQNLSSLAQRRNEPYLNFLMSAGASSSSASAPAPQPLKPVMKPSHSPIRALSHEDELDASDAASDDSDDDDDDDAVGGVESDASSEADDPRIAALLSRVNGLIKTAGEDKTQRFTAARRKRPRRIMGTAASTLGLGLVAPVGVGLAPAVGAEGSALRSPWGPIIDGRRSKRRAWSATNLDELAQGLGSSRSLDMTSVLSSIPKG